ncbi:MAG TPA: HAMP domain-containing sensor histidine kinase [Candidatus Eremiobacteraceae bacterium]
MKARGLRSRLTLAYASALVIGLVVFAVVSVVLLDRAFKVLVDQRLRSAAQAAASITDDAAQGANLDANDQRQFARIIGVKLDGALIQSDGKILISSAAAVPIEVRALARGDRTSSRLVTLTPAEPGWDRIRVAIAPFVRDGVVSGAAVAWRADDAIEDIDRPAVIAFAVAIPVIVALAALAGGMITRRGLAPLTAMANIASDIEASDLTRRLNAPKGDDELGLLCATFDRMLDRLQAAFERQRRFTADASHELRAPLSVIRAEADLALRKPRDGAEYKHALQAIANETDRLESLIGDLLVVARADEGGVSKPALVDFSASTREAADRLQSVADAKGVRLSSWVQPDLTVFADPESLSRVPVVLLDNAVKFAPAGGNVNISAERNGTAAILRVRDDGPGFSQIGLERATSRFWRENPARGRGGSGLGLAIARAIVEQAGGTIALANSPSGGAEVTVRVPLAIN